MDGPRPTLSLVLPAYNEEAGIAVAVAEADEALARLCGDYEILVVDDGSGDGTARAVEAACRTRPHVRLLRHPVNRGYGAALRSGFEAARFDRVAFTDADCQFHLDDLAGLLERAAEAPVVVGYRLDRQDPWRRRFLSRGYNRLAGALLGTTVRDIDCALKVFHRDALCRLLPESSGFFVNTEMLTRAGQLGLPVVEVGVRHRPRLRGSSTVSLREVPRTLGRLLPFWWSRVLFAGGVTAPGRSALLPGLALLLLLASLLFFSRLRAPLLEPQEVRYAEIPRQMLAAGQWLVPVLHGEPYLDKPPLLYWSVMASYRIFGVRDTSARLVPGLCGVLVVLMSYLWAYRLFGGGTALCGAMLLCLTPEFVYRGRMLTFDTLLAVWVVAALACAHLACLDGRLRRGWWLLSALACGLGLLTKGPVALVLAAGPVAAVSWLDPRLARPGRRAWTGYLAVAAAVAAPWYVAVALEQPEFVGGFFWRHNVVRFVQPFDHVQPFWYYLPRLAAGLLPWTLLLPGLALLFRDRSAAAAQRRPAGVGFLLAAALGTIVFFSAAGCKRPTYLLPALPPLALALGWYVHAALAAWTRASLLATASAGLALSAGVALPLAAAIHGMVRPDVGLALAGVGVTTAALLVLRGRRLAWSATAGVVFAGLWLAVLHLLPAYNDHFSLRGQLRRHATAAERGARAVVCYPQRYDSAHFYLPAAPVAVYGPHQRRELLAYLEENPGTLLLVKSGPVLTGLLRDLPPSVEFRTRQRRGAITVGRVVAAGDGPMRLLAREGE